MCGTDRDGDHSMDWIDSDWTASLFKLSILALARKGGRGDFTNLKLKYVLVVPKERFSFAVLAGQTYFRQI